MLESLAIASGGPARVAAAVSGRLQERGHDVAVATVPTEGESVPLGSEVERIDLCSRADLVNCGAAARKLRRMSSDADAVVVSGIWGPLDGLAVRMAGIAPERLFIRACGMLEEYILARSPLKKWLARKGYVDTNLNRCRSIIANTEIEQAYIQRMFPRSRVSVIPNGVDLPDLVSRTRQQNLSSLGLDLDDRAKVFLYLGRIHPKKGLDFLLRAFDRLATVDPDWHLVVAGDFDDSQYELKIRDLVSRCSSPVHLLGQVGGEKKVACLSLADAFVLPSHSEGFPNAVVEALSWGTPALVTPGCNFPEVASANAGVVSELDDDALVNGLQELCKDTDIRSENARKLVEERFTLDRVAEMYERLVEPEAV